MTRKPDRRGLGRGLTALLAESDLPASSAQSGETLALDRIEPNPDQPRRSFDEADLDELAASLRKSGLIQPLVVRPSPRSEDSFEIVAGERRWRAAQRAGLHDVPVIIRKLSDEQTLEIAIVENVQRVDLSPVEEARGYQLLIDRFGHTQEKLAEALGKSRSHITNTLRLLALPPAVLTHLANGRISAGHARALLGLDNPDAVAAQVISKGLSVRQTEAMVRQLKSGATAATPKTPREEKDADTIAIERELSAQLGVHVQIDHAAGQDGGTLRLRYRSLDDLDRLIGRLSGG